jgi:hypothetical protein
MPSEFSEALYSFQKAAELRRMRMAEKLGPESSREALKWLVN